MKFEIRQHIEPIDIFGRTDIVDPQDNRQIFIEGKHVGNKESQLILRLLDDLAGISEKTYPQLLSMKLNERR